MTHGAFPTNPSRLNPYSNGMLTQTRRKAEDERGTYVLILILMECLLRANKRA